MVLLFSRDPQIIEQQNEKKTQKCNIARKSMGFEPNIMALRIILLPETACPLRGLVP